MANVKITGLTSLTSGQVDRAVDVLEIADVSASQSKKITPNALMGISGLAVGDTDTQTLTNKTLTAPTISAPILSGTITGTYTLAGTPTFPAAVVTLTGSQTLTNKTLTSPTINTATIVNPTITADTIAGFSASTTGTIFGATITSGVLASAALVNSVNTAAIQNGAVDYTKVANGAVVQVVSTNFTAVATGTTLIPQDDTIPQITEGDQYMTQAITPKSTTNILVVEALASVSSSAINNMTVALFQDATTNALAAVGEVVDSAGGIYPMTIRHSMAAGTTSSTTFRIRIGTGAAGTTTFNGKASARLYGGITVSNIKITEYKA